MIHILRYLLFPFALLYGLVMALRNALFHWGVFKSESFEVPVISLGNITVGGTGKTPHSEYLISLLGAHYRVAVLSRGYGRQTKGFREVTAEASSLDCGDEPCQMKGKFPQAIVAVDEERKRGIKYLVENYQAELVLLDDAFQHRWVKPGLSLLLVDYGRPFFKDFVLPMGRLREFPAGKKRADIIVVTKCPKALTKEEKAFWQKRLKLNASQQLFFSTFTYGAPLPVFPDVCKPTLTLDNAELLLLTGIANPQPLADYLTGQGAHVKPLSFADHHVFTAKDVAKLQESYQSIVAMGGVILTTEKDAARLSSDVDLPQEIKEKLFYVPIQVQILDNEKEFNQIIESYVAKN